MTPCRAQMQIIRLIGKMPTLAAYAYRHRLGLPYVYPDTDLGYTKNYMNMLWKRTEPKFAANPVLARALEVLFILHADHEQNCSTSTMRAVGSSIADPYATTAAAIAALSGPLHGGANEEVLRMLDEIGSKDRIPAYIASRSKPGDRKLMGFGHRVYKNYDPRARIIKQVAEEVFEVTGRNPKIDIALELERIALEDEYFIKRKLYPNVDFYSGIIYQAMGFTPDAVHGAVRHPAHRRLAGAVAGDAAGSASRRSPARGRSIPANRSVRWCGSRSGSRSAWRLPRLAKGRRQETEDRRQKTGDRRQPCLRRRRIE